MTAQLLDILPWTQQLFLAGLFLFLRIGAVMALLPAFGEQSVPQRVRLGLALSFTMIIFPAVAPETKALTDTGIFDWPAAGAEVVIGLALGMVLRVLVLVLVMAGQIAAQATSLSQLFGGAGVEPQPAISALLTTAGLALAAMAGLHVRAAEAMILSYEAFPAGHLPDAGALAQWGISQIARGFGLALTLAIPFAIGSLIYNLALGVINRAMPQLMVALVGAPAITAGGLLLLLLSTPAMLQIWLDWMVAVLADPFSAGY